MSNLLKQILIMVNKKTQLLKIATPVSIVILGLGFLGYRKMFGNENLRKNGRDDRKQQTSVEPSKTKTVNDFESSKSSNARSKVDIEKYSTPEELISDLCRVVLIENESFKEKDEFLRKLVNLAYFTVDDIEWLEKLPKNIEECDNLLKSLGMFEKYQRKLKGERTVVTTTDDIYFPPKRVIRRRIRNNCNLS